MRDLTRALACGYKIAHVFYCPELDADHDIDALTNATLYELPRDIMEKISYRSTPSSIVAVMHQPQAQPALSDIASPLVLGLVNLQKPGNIGALLRTADATGFKAILLIDTSLDLYNPNVIRSSTGAVFLNNIYTVSGEQALAFFHDHDYSIIAGIVEGDTPLPEVDFRRKSAILLGTEDVGLDDFWQSKCDVRVTIPMVGEISDSFNVSVSGAIFMYEALRQTRW